MGDSGVWARRTPASSVRQASDVRFIASMLSLVEGAGQARYTRKLILPDLPPEDLPEMPM